MKKITLFGLLQLVVAMSFAQISEEVTFTHEGYTIYGTFTKPANSGKYPVIVICPGSGANDRNGTLVMLGATIQCMYPNIYGDTLRTYKDLATGLTAKGFAVLRYDKIEYTHSNFGAVTFKKLWLPFMSGVDYVKTRNDVDVSRIILAGHSEGGMLIPYAARLRNDISALINIAGARTPFDSLLAYQYRAFPRKCGQDTTQTDNIASQVLSYFALIRSGNWNVSTPPFAGVPAAVWAQYTHIGDSVVINYNLAAKPTLFLGLGRDNNVPIATEYNRFEQEITTPANFVKFPDLIHYMNAYNEEHASVALVDTIVYWLYAKGLAGIEESSATKAKLGVHYGEHEIVLSTDKDELVSAVILDVTGRELMQVKGTEIVLQRSLFTSGMYVVVARGKQNSYATKIWMR
ncbi:MAG: alpha/beta hydrolase [Bacteroidota bacterium]